MDAKIDKILDQLSDIKKVQGENRVTLVEHERRSTASEGRIGTVEALANKTWLALQKHFAKLEGAITVFKWTCIGLGGTGAAFGVLYGGVTIYMKFRGM